MKKTKFAVFASALLLLVTLLSSVSWQAPKQKVYKMLAILPLSGPAAVLGEFNKQGIDLAVEEINAKWAKSGKTLQIEYGDSKNDPKEGLLLFQKSGAQGKIPVVITAMSSVTSALIPPAEESNALLMATTVSAAGVTKGHKKVFRLFVRADIDAKTMAEFAAKKLKKKKAAILYVQDDFGASFRDIFKETFVKNGGQITVEEGYDRAETDFKAVLTRMKGYKFDAMYILGYEKTMGLIPKQMRELGINTTILSIGTLAQPYVMQQAGDTLEGAYFTTTQFDADNPRSKEAKKFVQKYAKKHGKQPNYFSAFAYDTVMILAKAIENSSSYTSDAVSKALVKIRKYKGAIGVISVDPDRDSRFPMVIRQIKNGKVRDVK